VNFQAINDTIFHLEIFTMSDLNKPITITDFRECDTKDLDPIPLLTTYYGNWNNKNLVTPSERTLTLHRAETTQGRLLVETSIGDWCYEPIYGVTTWVVTDKGIGRVEEFSDCGFDKQFVQTMLARIDAWRAANPAPKAAAN
jgi:hypothetical protein